MTEQALQLPFGGEIWEQREFPCMVCYIVTGSFGFGKSSDPRQRGNTTEIMYLVQEHLAEHLHQKGYVCVGQLCDLLLGPKHLKEIEELGREDPGRGNRWRETH